MRVEQPRKSCCSAGASNASADPAPHANVRPTDLYSPAVDELVAIGAAIACNCERCFKYHYARAKELGVTPADMAHAVATAQKVKSSPARAILELAEKHLNAAVPAEDSTKPDACACPSLNEPDAAAAVAPDAETVRAHVRHGYTQVARTTPSSPKSCCGSTGAAADELAKRMGYNEAELATLPDGANMGLSCGNPTALASLKPGESVLDLGSGGGFDCFLAGPRVGQTGRVIGVDMTPDMLTKARRNTAAYRERTGLNNVEFRLGEIEHLPVADNSVDVVISNCVLNLSPEKPQVWREIARVLKPGGRVAVSDLALLRPLPDQVHQMVEALVGCIAGAVLASDTERFMRDAGLIDLRLTQKPDYAASLEKFEDPLYQKIAAALPSGTTPADFITSLNITARKAE